MTHIADGATPKTPTTGPGSTSTFAAERSANARRATSKDASPSPSATTFERRLATTQNDRDLARLLQSGGLGRGASTAKRETTTSAPKGTTGGSATAAARAGDDETPPARRRSTSSSKGITRASSESDAQGRTSSGDVTRSNPAERQARRDEAAARGAGGSSSTRTGRADAAEAARRRAEETAGPTRSSRQLRTGSHEGVRDERIDELEGTGRKLAVIDTLHKVPTWVSPALSPIVGLVTGLDKEEAKEKRATVNDQLTAERAADHMVDVLYAMGADEDALEAADKAKVLLVDNDIDANAAYDADKKAVLMRRDSAEDVLEHKEHAEQIGAVEDGKVVDPARLDRDRRTDEVGKDATVHMVHEVVHAEQHKKGVLDRYYRKRDQLLAEARAMGRKMPEEDRAAIVASAKVEANEIRVRMTEVEAYAAHERADLELGFNRKVTAATERSGNTLPVSQATENLVNLEVGAPLLHGEDKGWSPGADLIASGAFVPKAVRANIEAGVGLLGHSHYHGGRRLPESLEHGGRRLPESVEHGGRRLPESVEHG